jgi:glycopeptide antibiotics resistance protein
MERGGPQAIRAAVVVYVLAYLTLSLFPYDFLISVQELSQKLAASSWGLIISASTCGRFSTCVIKLSAETAAVVPLGVLLGMVLGKRARHAYLISAVCGLALGFVTEVAQLFIASGISEGVSLLTRAVGMTLGVAVHRHLHLKRLTEMRQASCLFCG